MKLKPWPLVIVLLLASGLAFALIPDSNGVIHGCYKNSDGSLRVIDDSVSSCRTNETPLNWNASGPPGPPGPATAAFAADSGLNPITLPSGQPTTLVSLT